MSLERRSRPPQSPQPCVFHMLGLVPALLEHTREGARQLGINNPAHVGSRSRGGDCARENGVVALDGGVLETRVNVRRLQIGEVRESFLFRHTGGEHFEHVLHADAHPADNSWMVSREIGRAHV